MSDDIHAACDSRIMALESAVHIANTDAAHAVARLMGERDTARLQVDHFKAENERLQAERDRWKVTAEEADAFIRTWHEADPDGWRKILDERDRLRAAVEAADAIMRQCQNCHDDWLRAQDRLDQQEAT